MCSHDHYSKAEYYAGALPDGLGIRYGFKKGSKTELGRGSEGCEVERGNRFLFFFLLFFSPPTLATSNSTDCSSCFGMMLLLRAMLQPTSTLRKVCRTLSRLFLLLLIAALCHCFCGQVKRSVCLALRLSLEGLNSSCETTPGFHLPDETCHPVIFVTLKFLSGALMQLLLFLARCQ